MGVEMSFIYTADAQIPSIRSRMADKYRISVYTQGMLASSAMESTMKKLLQQESDALTQSATNHNGTPVGTASEISGIPNNTAGAQLSLADKGLAASMSLSTQYPELHSILTSREAVMASVSRQLATKGFDPIPKPFELKSW
jgi:hypothetical protein